jgi:glyoxylate reductase
MLFLYATQKKPMKKVFITRKIPSIAREMLTPYFRVDEFTGDHPIGKSLLMKVVSEYDAILTMFNDVIDKEVLSKAKYLEVISNYAIGLNNIDLDQAKHKKISVYNLPDIVTDSTADLTFAILLSLIRQIIPSNQYVLQGKWKGTDPLLFMGEELRGKTLGIIGFGRTGQAVAQRALGFGLNIIFYNRSKKESDKGIEQKSFEEVLKLSDYISLHVPLTKDTHKMIAAKEFQMMEKNPVLVNMARGSVVDTDALVEALKKGWIRSCALDVTDPEPIANDHPLCSFENCLIVPHIGTATKECRYNMAQKAAENIITHFIPN